MNCKLFLCIQDCDLVTVAQLERNHSVHGFLTDQNRATNFLRKELEICNKFYFCINFYGLHTFSLEHAENAGEIVE